MSSFLYGTCHIKFQDCQINSVLSPSSRILLSRKRLSPKLESNTEKWRQAGIRICRAHKHRLMPATEAACASLYSVVTSFVITNINSRNSESNGIQSSRFTTSTKISLYVPNPPSSFLRTRTNLECPPGSRTALPPLLLPGFPFFAPD